MIYTVDQINTMEPGSVLLKDGKDFLKVIIATPWTKKCEICDETVTNKICKWEIEGRVNTLLLCPACAVEEIIERAGV